MFKLLNGRKLSKKIKLEIAKEVAVLLDYGNRAPNLAVVIVGEDPASKIYVKNKIKACHKTGMISSEYILKETTTQEELEVVIDFLNNDEETDAILVQLPLPSGINEKEIISRISPLKDVDGFHPINVGKLFLGEDTIESCTPKGIIRFFDEYRIDIKGKRAIIVGRSNIVGKPIAHLLLQRDATVTIAHSKTENLSELIKESDIVIAAIGKPKFIKGDWIKKGAVVIDVGINYEDGKLVGDVDFEEASKVASYITPVPKGVGPMTIAMLLENTLELYKNKLNSNIIIED